MLFSLFGNLTILSGLAMDSVAARVAFRLGLKPFGPDLEGRWEDASVLVTRGLGFEFMMCKQVEPPPVAQEIGLSVMSRSDAIYDGSERRADVGTYVKLLLDPVQGLTVTADPPWRADGVDRVAIKSFRQSHLQVKCAMSPEDASRALEERLDLLPFRPSDNGSLVTTCIGLELRLGSRSDGLEMILTPAGGDEAAPDQQRLDAGDYVRMLIAGDERFALNG